MPRARSIAHPAPKGRNISAQGNALGNRPPIHSSPEGATQCWRIAKISDFAKTTSGGTPSRANPAFYTGNIPWIKSGDLNDGNVSEATEFITEEALKNSSAKLFPAGTLMIALYGATIGKLGILSIEAATNQAVCGIFVPEDVETKYLFYFLLYHRPALIKLGAGGAQPNISQGIIRDIEVPLPPLPEQRRIVARIEELFSRLDAGVAALRHAKAQLQRYRQSVLAAAVTGQLTQAWREQHADTEPAEEAIERILAERRVQWEGKGKYKEPKTPNPEEPIPLPTGWCLVSPEHISTHIVDCPHSTPKWTATGEICLRTTNFLPGRMILDEVRYVSPATYSERIARLEPQPGDVLYSREGGILGLACIIPNGLKACLGQRMMQFRIDADIALPEYFNFVLNSPMILSEVKRMTGGSASPHLNIGDIRAFPIPLPPVAEQHQIVAEVEARTTAIDHLEAELDRQITRSNRLRQSTLESAFAGNFIPNA
jgi:type I restriction enzyme S subunit